MGASVQHYSLFTDFDINLFKSGKHFRLYEKMGSHPLEVDGVKGTYFAVWAPAAKAVCVVGDFNYWTEEHWLNVRWDESGIWEGFIPGVEKGVRYKYKIHSHHHGKVTEKADPYALHCEKPPLTASVVWQGEYQWKDSQWMKDRKVRNQLDQPFSIYELHIDSWKKIVEENRPLSFLEMAEDLVKYVKEMGFTHVEMMPIMEYPYDPSWGYQITGYFAPSSRFGTPEEFMALVDSFHQAGIGVILDWVPSHFPSDWHGLGYFDGSHLYEHPDLRKGYHPDWKSLVFNYGRNEVRAFLISNALYWLDRYHIDGLRVDAVASMLYLDYSRKEGEWEPNIYGGRENFDAISFLKEFNGAVYSNYEGVQTIAEESTAFSKVSRPLYEGGLGFGMKWMMGWMHDTLDYFKRPPIYRKYHQNDITFSMVYAFTENFMLPLSHDEVVYGKGSLVGRMPGDQWQRFANLRLMFSYMFTHPGGKLLFMGGEFGHYAEWNFRQSLDWHLLENPYNKGMQDFIKDLNKLYTQTKSLYEKQFSPEGFEWINIEDRENSVLVYLRKGNERKDDVVVVLNMTPSVHYSYRIGVPQNGKLKELLNSDLKKYHGSGIQNSKPIPTESVQWHGQKQSAEITLPPLAALVFTINPVTSRAKK